ncbi:MAG: hypothetical protein LBR41_02480, partial [Rickettsiales bacterium]|nr:hypothetical protein [Rickettsiales bacterium]
SLQRDIENNTNYMNGCVVESDAMRESLNALSDAVADGFKNVADAAANYENLMSENEKSLARQIEKMDVFSTQSKQMLKSQTNELAGTANVIGGQIKLAEASIEKQTAHLATAITSLMEAAQNTENYIRNISNELALLTGRFQTETREFASSVVGSLTSTQGAANDTLEQTRGAAAAFSESVRMMAAGVQDTISAMETAHNRLSNQSAHLAEITTASNDKLQPLAELVEKYGTALPEMTAGLADAAENFESKIKSLTAGMQSAMLGLADSSVKLEHMSDTSRATLTDLMSDYSRAADTMETLTTSMAETRARAPMAAVAKSPAPTAAMTTAEFMKRSENLMERMHELSVDLTRTIGSEIPDAVWKKYNAGDKTIFSKWFAKMLGATDKKKLQQLFKSDAVFRSQATQFVRGFAKMLGAAEMTDNRDMLSATLLKTDLGQMYLALRAYL